MRLALAGDTVLGRGVAQELEQRPPQSLVADEIVELARAADLCVVNLECAISERGEPVPKAFNFRAPPQAVETLVHLGVDCVLLANNHALDHGIDALLDTFAHLRTLGSAGRARARPSSRHGHPSSSKACRSSPSPITRPASRPAPAGPGSHTRTSAADLRTGSSSPSQARSSARTRGRT